MNGKITNEIFLNQNLNKKMVQYDIVEIDVIPTKIIGISAWDNLRNECYPCYDPFSSFLDIVWAYARMFSLQTTYSND